MNKLINRVRQHKKAFTLIELVIVILIIAILAIVLIPQLSSMTNKAKMAGVQEDFHEFQIASQAVAYEQSGLPNTFDTKNSLFDILNKNLDAENRINEAATPAANSGVSNNKDPWNNEYQVDVVAGDANGVGGKITFSSGGPDGAITGDGKTTDNLSTTIEYTTEGSVKVTTNGFSLDKTA